MRRRLLLTGLAGSLGVGVLSGCTGDPPMRQSMRLGTGEVGGVYRPLGSALVRAMQPRWQAKALLTAASVDNLERLVTNRAQMAFCAVDAAAQARSGLGSFAGKFDVHALAGLYSDYVHVVMRADSFNDLDGLAGRPVSTGAPGSGTEVVAARMMAAAGINVRGFERHRLGLVESIAALRTGIIDAFFFSGGIPTPAIAELAASNSPPITLLNLQPYLETMQSQFGEVYSAGFIPNSAYGRPSAHTVCISNVLAVPPTMSEDLAYQLTRLLFAAKPQLERAHPEGRQLDPRLALATYPVPLHAGAERYLREQKDR